MDIVSPEGGNELIRQHIESGKKFAVSRSGLTELVVMSDILNGRNPTDQTISDLRIVAGVYKSSVEEFYEEYSTALSYADLQIAWQGSKVDSIQSEVFQRLSPNSIKIGHRAVEPFYFENPWSLGLEGKKVLVVTSISQTVKYQSKRLDKIWGAKKMFPQFEIETYNSVQSIGNRGPHSSWKESLDIMRDEISELDFDVALLGCGAYGMPLVAHIKNNMGKSAIYVGGAIQIMFGIKGVRWDSHPEISTLFNEHWRRPFDIERPENAYMAEGGAYW